MASLYWIRQANHTDIFSQGYVGVSNNFQKRMYQHQNLTKNAHLSNAIAKYGWDNLVKEVVLIADDSYCLDIEAKLRNKDHIGWNLVVGGGNPPKLFGNTYRVGKPSPNKGKKGQIAWNKGIPRTEELKAKLRRLVTCPICNKIGGLSGMKAWHFDNCKSKE